ncbi:MAG: DNA polymerase III subunit alpha [Candidatus Eisenbacteria bacterium]|nr:DNA polymerase III subunit alpha [Candidatus Eisenbacteria bacterium]
MARTFVHLHNHTHFSLLDGACRIEDMMEAAKKQGMPAVAMTDHGNLFAAVEFFEKAKATGIKPILGIEAYVNPGPLEPPAGGKKQKEYCHLILLAKNQAGWQNLMKLSSRAYLEGFYYKPRMDHAMLAAHSEGLIGLSGCLSGEVASALCEGRFDEARETARFYREIFDGQFYLELQDHGLDLDRVLIPRLIDLARELDMPLVATNDAHYIAKEHAHAHEALLCIQTGKNLSDPDRFKFDSHEMYFKSTEEMFELFAGQESALSRTVDIAELCDVALEFGKLKLPHFPKPDRFATLDDFLEDMCGEGLRRRYGTPTDPQWERLRFELNVIKQMGYAGYFLIVQDFIAHARSVGVPVGPGRGSAAGSIVAYCLGITNIDPLAYNLLFERFLNPERISMPDIDVDFSDRGRGEVIEYVVQKYGKENVCQIITFGTMAARAAVRDVGRVMGMPYTDVDKIAKMVPAELHIKLDKALDKAPDLKARYDADPKVHELIGTAQVLEGLARHASTHAAGVVITPTPLTDHVPLFRTNDDEIVTQFDMVACEKIGLLKMDFLGLRTLTVLQDSVQFIQQKAELLAREGGPPGAELDLDTLPMDDPEPFALLARGETVGIFQFESSGMTDYMRKLKPSCLEDMIAMNALYRPGPLGSGMVEDFIQRKQGVKAIQYEHPLLEPILRETYGVIVYQEQVMQIATALAGYSLGEADLLRRAMGKKKAEIMAKEREGFVSRSIARSIPKRDAEKIFDLCAHFAGYGFNKSHSAGYALVAYQTAWLKAHHPVEFMAATLTSEMANSDRIMVLLAECRRLGIDILPPDVNCSAHGFAVARVARAEADGTSADSNAVERGAIRFGLGAVKGIGQTAVESIVSARTKEPFRDLFDLCARIDHGPVNRKCLEALITSGALDGFGEPRARLLESLPLAMEWAARRRREQEMGQGSLFGGGTPGEMPRPAMPSVAEWPTADRLAREKGALGFYVSGHPLDAWRRALTLLGALGTHLLEGRDDQSPVLIGGLPITTRVSADKQGRPICFLTVEDFTGTVECLAFSEPFANCRVHLTSERPLLIKGRLSTRELEKPKILVEEAIALPDLVEKGRLPLHLALSSAWDDERLERIRERLRAFPGNCPVFLHVDPKKLGGMIVKLRSHKITPEEGLLAELEALAGPGGMKLTAGEPKSFRSVEVFGDTRTASRRGSTASVDPIGVA